MDVISIFARDWVSDLRYLVNEWMPLEAIWWTRWFSGEEYYHFLYCAIYVAQIVKELAFYKCMSLPIPYQ